MTVYIAVLSCVFVLTLPACGSGEPPVSDVPATRELAPPPVTVAARTTRDAAPDGAGAASDDVAAAPGHAVLGAGAAVQGSLLDLAIELEDQAGQRRALAPLRGAPFIVAMFYSRCSYACPTLVWIFQRIDAACPRPCAPA